MKSLSEVHGMDLIERLAVEKSKDPKAKKRIWSDEMQSWGFFAEIPTEMDVFLIMGCCRPGDMFVTIQHSPKLFKIPSYETLEASAGNSYVVLGLKFVEISGTYFYALEMLASNPPVVCQMLAQHTSLFKIAWDCLPR